MVEAYHFCAVTNLMNFTLTMLHKDTHIKHEIKIKLGEIIFSELSSWLLVVVEQNPLLVFVIMMMLCVRINFPCFNTEIKKRKGEKKNLSNSAHNVMRYTKRMFEIPSLFSMKIFVCNGKFVYILRIQIRTFLCYYTHRDFFP